MWLIPYLICRYCIDSGFIRVDNSACTPEDSYLGCSRWDPNAIENFLDADDLDILRDSRRPDIIPVPALECVASALESLRENDISEASRGEGCIVNCTINVDLAGDCERAVYALENLPTPVDVNLFDTFDPEVDCPSLRDAGLDVRVFAVCRCDPECIEGQLSSSQYYLCVHSSNVSYTMSERSTTSHYENAHEIQKCKSRSVT